MKNNKLVKEKSKSKKQYTPWHTLLAEVMIYIIDPDDFVVHPFEKLGTLPLESDFIIIRKSKPGKLKKNLPGSGIYDALSRRIYCNRI